MRHNGVGVYHTYKNDVFENGANTYWFVTDPYATIDDAFDVRELPVGDEPEADRFALLDNYRKVILFAAIELGILTADGVKEVAR